MQEIAKVDQRTRVEKTTVDLVLHRLFNADNVPPALIESIRQYQHQLLNKGITQSIDLNHAVVNECRIAIGNMTLAIQSSLAKDELSSRLSQLSLMDTTNSANPGQLNWQFAGNNQFNHITIRIEEQTWEVEFARLQRPIHRQYQPHKTRLKTQAHQKIYQKLCDVLKPIAQSTLAQTVLLQGPSGLGKTHCAQYYFYHQARQHHQMVAWLSGHSEEAFLQDWQALAQQLRNIDSSQSKQNDEMVIRNWCENQLGQWLFIIDDVNVDAAWLAEQLPRQGGHIFITTSCLNYLLHPNQITLPFSLLTEDDSKQLLHAYVGEYWQATGYPEEEKAVNYLSKALGGSPVALTQTALLVRKKSLSFQRVMEQFKQPALRTLLLADTVFEQLKGKTFLVTIQKNWNQLITYLAERYPHVNHSKHEQQLTEFIKHLQQEMKLPLAENIAEIQIPNAAVQTYWEEVWATTDIVFSEVELQTCLSYLSLSYDVGTNQWQLSLAGLTALALCCHIEPKLTNLLNSYQTNPPNQREANNNTNQFSQLVSDNHETNLESTQQSLLTVTDSSVIKNLSQLTSYYFESGQNVRRDTLYDEEKVKQKIANRLPKHFQLGAAIGKGDCFFDAMAQSLNRLRGREEYTVKSLRLLCDDYVKSGKHAWVKEAIEAEGNDYHQYLLRIPFTVEELEEEEKGNSGLKLEDIVWGRPEIEGRIISEIINIKLHVIGILEESIQGTDIVEQLIDAQAPEPIIMIEEGQYDNFDGVHLVNYQNHFVPLLDSKIRQDKKFSTQVIEESQRNVWEKLSLPSGMNFSINLQDSSLKHAEIMISAVGKPSEFHVWQLPTINPYFIPRPTLTQALAEKLPQRKAGEASAQLLLTAATGMGGIGKTELARHFITNPDLSSHYQQRFWFTATTESQLRIQFYQLAVYLGLIDAEKYIEDKELITLIHKWLSIHPGWLMVLDNADDYHSIATWIPKEGGAVLVTTREPTPGVLSPEQIVPVPLLMHEEAVVWLYQLSGRNPVHSTKEEKGAVESLVKDLGYLPLAIAQAAAYLREQSHMSIEEYHSRFHTLFGDATLAQQEAQHDDKDAYSRKVLASTWLLSLRAIEEAAKARHLIPLAQPLLTACAYLAPKNIPVFLLEAFLKELYQIEPTLVEYVVDDHIGQLVRYSLLERNSTDNAVSMHNLVQEVIINALPSEERQVYLIGIILILQKTYPYQEIEQLEDYIKQRILLPHLEKGLQQVEEWSNQLKKAQVNEKCPSALVMMIEKELFIRLLVLSAHGYSNLGHVRKQKVLLEQALIIKEQHYEKNHPQIALTLGNLANAYGTLGDAQKQKQLLERVLAIQEGYYGKDHPEISATLCNLAVAYGDLGNIYKKKDLLEHALQIQEQYKGKNDLAVSLTLNNLALAWGALGDNWKARELLEQALTIQKQYYGKDHPMLSFMLDNLANIYGTLGDAQQHKQISEQALFIIEKHYGKDHPAIARALNNLAAAYGDLDDVRQQKQLSEQALMIQKKYYQKEHPEMVRTLINLANAYGTLRDVIKQKELAEWALSIKEKYYGKEHQEVVSTLIDLASVYGSLGDINVKKQLLERALSIQEQYYGENNILVALILHKLANTYGYLGETHKQKKLLEQALKIKKQHYGEDHSAIADILQDLAAAYGALGDVQMKKKLLEQTLPIQENRYGKAHPQVALTLNNLATAYGDLGNIYKKKLLLEDALQIQKKHYGKNHLAMSSTLNNLANTYGDLGDAQTKKTLLEQALQIEKEHYGEGHLEVALTLGNLANVYGDLGDTYKKKKLLKQVLPILEKHYGKYHPEVGRALGNLANAYGSLGNSIKQKEIMQQVLNIFKANYGDNHPEVAFALYNLTFAYEHLGEWSTAKKMADHAYQIFFTHPDAGPQHPHTQAARKRLDTINLVLATFSPEQLSELHAHSNTLATEKNSPDLTKALRNAANQNNVEKLRELLSQKIDVNAKDEGQHGRTALHWAVIKQAYPCIKLLLVAGADALMVDKAGKLSINYAEENSTPDALFILLSHHYKLPLENIDAGKLLRRAAHQNRVNDIKLLLRHIKNINEKDAGKDQRTALHWAMIQNAADCIKILIAAGADPHLADGQGKNAYDYAKGKSELLSLLPSMTTQAYAP